MKLPSPSSLPADLIVTVVPLVDGAVEITGFDITYRDGGGDRSEQIAAEIVIG